MYDGLTTVPTKGSGMQRLITKCVERGYRDSKCTRVRCEMEMF